MRSNRSPTPSRSQKGNTLSSNPSKPGSFKQTQNFLHTHDHIRLKKIISRGRLDQNLTKFSKAVFRDQVVSRRSIPPAPTENKRYHEFSIKGTEIPRKREISRCIAQKQPGKQPIPAKHETFRPRPSIHEQDGRWSSAAALPLTKLRIQPRARREQRNHPPKKKKGDVRTTEPQTSVVQFHPFSAATRGPVPDPSEAASRGSRIGAAREWETPGSEGEEEGGVRIRYLARPWWPCRG